MGSMTKCWVGTAPDCRVERCLLFANERVLHLGVLGEGGGGRADKGLKLSRELVGGLRKGGYGAEATSHNFFLKGFTDSHVHQYYPSITGLGFYPGTHIARWTQGYNKT
jgi:hypothetical protein